MERDTLSLPSGCPAKDHVRPQAPYGIFHGSKGLLSEKRTLSTSANASITGKTEKGLKCHQELCKLK